MSKVGNRKAVKICGLKTTEAAVRAIDAGASLLGVILVPNRSRTVDYNIARDISKACLEARQARKRESVDSKSLLKHLRASELTGAAWFEYSAQKLAENGPFLVGVFRNQPLNEVLQLAEELNLDIIQLHGSENFAEFVSASERPVIPRYVLQKPNIGDALETHKHILPLLDSELGGEGKVISWDDAGEFGRKGGRFVLAGGLKPENVASALAVEGVLGVDVSGGVETNGSKDMGKIDLFVRNANERTNNERSEL